MGRIIDANLAVQSAAVNPVETVFLVSRDVHRIDHIRGIDMGINHVPSFLGMGALV